MFAWSNKTILMLAMAATGLGLLATPVMTDLTYPSAAVLSSGVIGAVMVLVAVGLGYGSLEWWSRFAIGIATWTLVAPLLLGFYEAGAGFWAHMAAGLVSLLCGVAAHELMARDPAHSDRV